ncbi:hypothetical protein FRC16_008356, partial [Serendipita sp. 398]
PGRHPSVEHQHASALSSTNRRDRKRSHSGKEKENSSPPIAPDNAQMIQEVLLDGVEVQVCNEEVVAAAAATAQRYNA